METKPLGRDILIVDIDMRSPNGENEVFNNATKMAREAYKFVVFINADAMIEPLEVPMGFLFNRWNISPDTSIAMPVDTKPVVDGKDHSSADSKGKEVLNTGDIVLQNLPYTFEMLDAWIDCTSEKRNPGCGEWRQNWSHEQRAYSEYIRIDIKPTGNNAVEIPCNEANGCPGEIDFSETIIDDCRGEFTRHYPGCGSHKDILKTNTADAIVQSLGELLQKKFELNQERILVEEVRQ
ncbi:1b9475cd-0b24-40d6-9a9f-b8ec0922850a [Thermothielavioides terrestris]|uniref:1b9475cd-0b24-40d6-9a9f-b8ec0922850a n=1 Tax=Thermothielavioides terrestris TaxID=2587410 RepID=A0A446BP96_9PEZI|nr:1b9475cd-0b24-40d6-9a9f-b8ec0922850a [Thermothielavioides terrestris]